MKITLAEWKEIEAALSAIKRACEVADSKTFAIHSKYYVIGTGAEATPETALLWKINRAIHELRGECSVLPDCHPQSEWMGGDSDNPSNHKLREPNCCPMPRRHFTDTEVEEAGAVCQGPVDWSYAK